MPSSKQAERVCCVALGQESRRLTLLARITITITITLGLCACSSSALSAVVPQARTAAKLPHHVFETTPFGMRIASLPRATPRVLWLALYLDAGSRDASLPETATLSARLAAERAGAAVEATVFPDVTELSLSCTQERLEGCVQQLALALAARDPDADALALARTRLRDDQRRALAADPDAPLDVLAMRALLGGAADGFFPLGKVDSDLVAAGKAVPHFLRAHYGPERALLVAAGDIGPNDLMDAASRAFQAAPAALQSRATRALGPRQQPTLTVSFEDTSGVTLALAGHDEATLGGVTQKLSALASEAEPRLAVSGNIFAARSGAIALIRLRGADPQLALERATRALTRMQREPTAARPPEAQPDDLRSSVRALGLEFAAEGSHAPRALCFGAALALEAGPDAGPADLKRAERERKRREQAQAAFERTLAEADPELHGELDHYVAAVTLDNGAHLDVQFTQGRWVAVAIRVGSGAAADPPSQHGRAALLATLTTQYCAGMGPQLLQGRLAQLGATLTPRVDAESYGVLLRVPEAHFSEATELALRCMQSPSRDPAHIVEAGVHLQQQLRAADSDALLRARAADLISPRAPGPLAPWGDPSRLPNLQPHELEQSLRDNAVGARWAIGVVGPVDVHSSTAWLARRLAELPGPPHVEAPHWDEPSSSLPSDLPRSHGQQGTRFVAAWIAHGAFPGALGARLFARALGALVSALPGVKVLWHEADSYKQTSFAALALQVQPERLASAPVWLSEAAHSIDDVWLERALEPAVAQAERSRSAAQAQLAVRAEQIARLRLGAQFEPDSLDSARKQLLALRQAQPGFAAAP